MRKIIHVDMDAFYASVEQRDRPELRGRPVIVGGDPAGRGVVAACSYEARRFGIHSAMPCATAHRLCPRAVFIRPRFDVYRSVSLQIRKIFHEYTDLVEPLSLDEAFLDVTENKWRMPSATLIAQAVRQKIRQTTGGLTASAGVSFNKFLAKVASDENKPDGITVVTPETADDFVAALPIRKFFGVGRVTEGRMLALGIRNGGDLRRFDREALTGAFGKAGGYFYDIARGIDRRRVQPDRARKSIGKETTLKADIDDVARMTRIVDELALKVAHSAAARGERGHTVTLKVKYFDFRTITRSVTLPAAVTDADAMTVHLHRLLAGTDAGAGKKKVRLLGVTLSNFASRPADGKPSGPAGQLPLPFRFRTDVF